MIDRAHVDAAVALGCLAGSKKPPGPIASPAHRSHRLGIPDNCASATAQPLRYFDNGTEVDIEGNPLPTMHATPTAKTVQDNSNKAPPPPSSTNLDSLDNIILAKAVQDNSNKAPPPPSSTHLDSLDNIILAKFLTVVVSRVPEISSALADLLPEGGAPLLFQREYPDVIDITLAKL